MIEMPPSLSRADLQDIVNGLNSNRFGRKAMRDAQRMVARNNAIASGRGVDPRFVRNSFQGWVEMIVNQRAAGTLFNTYTTSKSVINPQALYVFPANYFVPGKMLRVTVSGGLSNVVTSQPTFTFETKLGPTANIVVFTSGAITTTTTAHTLIPFKYVVDLRCDTDGSGTSAKFLSQGILNGIMWVVSGATADLATTMTTIMCPNTAPAVGTGFDATVANIFDFWVGISASSASNGIQIYNYTVEAMN